MNNSTDNFIYTHNIAADILDIFDEFLCEREIVVPSVNDNQRDPDNTAALYGTEYGELLNDVENYIIQMLKGKCKGMDIMPYVFK